MQQVFFLDSRWEKWFHTEDNASDLSDYVPEIMRRNFQKLTAHMSKYIIAGFQSLVSFVNGHVYGAVTSKTRISDTWLDVSLSSHTWKKRYAPFDWLLGSMVNVIVISCFLLHFNCLLTRSGQYCRKIFLIMRGVLLSETVHSFGFAKIGKYLVLYLDYAL